MSEMAKIPWPDLEKILFFSDFLNQRDKMSNASKI